MLLWTLCQMCGVQCSWLTSCRRMKARKTLSLISYSIRTLSYVQVECSYMHIYAMLTHSHIIHTFTHSLTHLVTHPLTHSHITHTLSHSPTHSLTASPAHSLPYNNLYSLTYLLMHSLLHPFTHSLTYSLNHSLPLSPTHSHIRSIVSKEIVICGLINISDFYCTHFANLAQNTECSALY